MEQFREFATVSIGEELGYSGRGLCLAQSRNELYALQRLVASKLSPPSD
jgi:hypothetical protein